MLTLELVAHCFCYERCLTYFLSALYLHPPRTCHVTATIYHATPADDPPTSRVLDFFASLSRQPSAARNIELSFRELPIPQLCRRAIGRNMAAKSTTADFLLFSDVDYLYGEGALDAAAAKMLEACGKGENFAPKLMHVRELRSSIDHASGDAELARVNLDRLELIEPLPDRYTTSGLALAIGGSQWIPGSFAREKGYLHDGHRHLREAGRWMRTFDDKCARGWWGLPTVALDIPNVWRIRHSARGREQIGCRN